MAETAAGGVAMAAGPEEVDDETGFASPAGAFGDAKKVGARARTQHDFRTTDAPPSTPPASSTCEGARRVRISPFSAADRLSAEAIIGLTRPKPSTRLMKLFEKASVAVLDAA